ncbi:YhcH/YjgK/YiaL family protein [Lignipirellula cremea]|uniref:Toxin-antitoxin biofilm protein TabA n=1 Tax=Lignipirellula cremea TaxID=2528010 RepID=A0A518DZN4_9BACT|nr:YhcH/YjgK/YiaL family protein [Lignipirellula cremea]QDU97310.1 Toxin-antitoxin biofilm protein TabA [Lignipirellula cremea]
MILDRIEHADRYASVHKRFADAFAWIRAADWEKLEDGRHEIDGDQLYAVVSRANGIGKEKSLLESHRKYIDIQYIFEGKELIGWSPLADCTRVSEPYDADKDMGFFFDRPDTWVHVPVGAFVVFYPDDAHATLGGEGLAAKVIMKIAVDE